eukprot:TRINITY_DN107303_c0_g1_i1.p1 TRINITY_DN107303_c0_g1~~TRINITY_DN107303_c0_g1_i1.p1  ORF type:complete len:150 (-),score=35.90 TRINITY_DN107303_c0_g1_i1:65-514(-)
MVKRGADDMAASSEVFVMGADGICQGIQSPPNPERLFADMECEDRSSPKSDQDEAMPQSEERQSKKPFVEHSPVSTAASTPELAPTTSPEARARARASNLGQLPVRTLKARLKDFGADISGATEKTELVAMLEQLEFANCTEKVPPFQL